MQLCQAIYTTTCTDAMTSEKAVLISEKSVEVCCQLGLTGRVFSNDRAAFAVTEGPCDLVLRYRQAIEADQLVQTFLLQTERPVAHREFPDYSVWLNVTCDFQETAQVRALRPEKLVDAMPVKVSPRVRILAEAYLDREMLAG